jgi:O-antigen ligase
MAPRSALPELGPGVVERRAGDAYPGAPRSLLDGGHGPNNEQRIGRADRSTIGLALLAGIAFLAAWSPGAAAWVYSAIAAAAAILLNVHRLRLRTPDVLAGLIAAWAFATVLWTVDEVISQRSASMYATACLLFVAARQVIRTRSQLVAVAVAHLAGCAATAAKLISTARDDLSPQRVSTFDYSVRYGVDGVNFNYTAYTLVTGAVLAVVLLYVAPSRAIVRAGLLSLVAVFVYGVILTGCKGATIGLLLGAAGLLAAHLNSRITWNVSWPLVPALLVLVPLVLPYSFGSWTQFLDGLFGRETGDLSGRLEVWSYALSASLDHPLLGIGSGVFYAANPSGIPPHTLIFTLTTDVGIIGVLLYASVFATALIRTTSGSALGRKLATVFTISLLPIWLSGQWEYAPAVWLVLALLSVLPTLVTTAQGTDRPQPWRLGKPLGPLAMAPR